MKFKTIYVLCPKGVKTGGPELLHQLAYQINKLSSDSKAVITYYGDLNQKPVDEYNKYLIGDTTNFKDINDEADNVVIFPETAFTELFDRYKNVKKYIWWLSINNYFAYNSLIFSIRTDGLLYSIGRMLKGHLKNNIRCDREKFEKADLHLCQSVYAEKYLMKNEDISSKKIKYLSDYINTMYIHDSNNALHHEKRNIVLYNPKKGYKFTKKIIKKTKNKKWKWIALKDLTNEEVKKYLEMSKIYIDFGNHPGKDRFPREAAILGCCVITDKKGSAAYFEDVPINNQYKFEDTEKEIPEIIEKMEDCMNNYDRNVVSFSKYRAKIMSEHARFAEDCKEIFSLN